MEYSVVVTTSTIQGTLPSNQSRHTTATATTSAADVPYKVWVVMGPECLELPTTDTGIGTHMAINVKEGEEKMARKVLRHLRLPDVGEGMERVGSDGSKYPIFLPPLHPLHFFSLTCSLFHLPTLTGLLDVIISCRGPSLAVVT